MMKYFTLALLAIALNCSAQKAAPAKKSSTNSPSTKASNQPVSTAKPTFNDDHAMKVKDAIVIRQLKDKLPDFDPADTLREEVDPNKVSESIQFLLTLVKAMKPTTVDTKEGSMRDEILNKSDKLTDIAAMDEMIILLAKKISRKEMTQSSFESLMASWEPLSKGPITTRKINRKIFELSLYLTDSAFNDAWVKTGRAAWEPKVLEAMKK